MKILSVGHSQRKFGKVANLFSKKFNYGLIRLGHHIYEFDDREVARSQSPFRTKFGGTMLANRRFLEVCENFWPQIIFLGHADLISKETLKKCRMLIPDVKIAHWTVDAFYIPRHSKRFQKFLGLSDALFATTGGSVLAGFKTPGKCLAYIPNAVDSAIDCLQNDQQDAFDFDLLFCGSPSSEKPRDSVVEKIAGDSRLVNVRFEVRGLMGKSGVYGDKYDQLLKRSKMALNLSRDNDSPLCSSDRISQLLGNGLLTFIPESTGLKEIISAKEAIFFRDYEDLVEKILYYNTHDSERKSIAEAGRIVSHQRFSSERVARFMIELTMGLPLSEKYEWERHLFM
jgi:glycosyltransferase involved in cell wall biosynthesis